MQLVQLLQFLHDKNPQVRQIALANLVGHTTKGSLNRNIFFAGLGAGGLSKDNENDCIRDLKLLCRDQLVTCSTLLSLKIPVIPLPIGSPPYYPTQSRSGTSPSPSPYPSGDSKDVQALPLLVQAFSQSGTSSAPTEQRIRKADLHFLSSVFANLSMASSGRSFFLTPRPTNVLASETVGELEYPLLQLIAFTEHADTIRRGGVASTIKNCAFYIPAHKAMLYPETEAVAVPPSNVEAPGMNILPYILLPLAGPEEFDFEDQEKLPAALQLLPDTKKREQDAVLRRTHVETLILFCTTRSGRDYLRNNGVYEVVRTLHLVEQNEIVRENIERLVNLLKGDERPLEEVDSDGWSHGKLALNNMDSPQGPDVGGNTDQGRAEVRNTAPPRSPPDENDEDKIIEI
ncbi:DUF383-domain-containing protein [Fomitiporia mediterranea MF3/22]|uniref:DUF383-domain-containing protein n=1 Tax=Fomitiporia mediterranea (strain MF3/22) TaxID=694068 RepID=UPI000440945E|nr:DUF383-domain-containing protein [Fomitiporia mediterranea MF3/22]EJD07430.1 DUF383-domain-containing protein [Fomitiporia mediterranea MF3/22]